MMIAGMPAGTFVKRARKQRGFKLTSLADEIISESLLSNFENGKKGISREKLAFLLERLGFDADIIDAEDDLRKNKIRDCVIRRDNKSAIQLLCALENDYDFMDETRNKQFVAIMNAGVAINLEKPPGEIRSIILHGLKITIPHFHEKYVSDYLLTGGDIELIKQLASLYEMSGDKSAAIKLMYNLIANLETNCTDERRLAKYYPSMVFNLTTFLCDMNEYEKAIHLCDKGIAVCRKSYALFTLPKLIANKALCLYEMGDEKKGKALFLEAYYLYDAYELFDSKKRLHDYVFNKYKLNLYKIALI